MGDGMQWEAERSPGPSQKTSLKLPTNSKFARSHSGFRVGESWTLIERVQTGARVPQLLKRLHKSADAEAPPSATLVASAAI